jgi:hypothetical protein
VKLPKRNARGQFEIESGTYVDSKGYLAMCAGPLRGWRIHRLVAIAKFGIEAVQKPDAVIHHKDSDKTNPHPDNLELLTARQHNAHTARQLWYLRKHVWPKEKAAWNEYHGLTGIAEPDACSQDDG